MSIVLPQPFLSLPHLNVLCTRFSNDIKRAMNNALGSVSACFQYNINYPLGIFYEVASVNVAVVCHSICLTKSDCVLWLIDAGECLLKNSSHDAQVYRAGAVIAFARCVGGKAIWYSHGNRLIVCIVRSCISTLYIKQISILIIFLKVIH